MGGVFLLVLSLFLSTSLKANSLNSLNFNTIELKATGLTVSDFNTQKKLNEAPILSSQSHNDPFPFILVDSLGKPVSYSVMIQDLLKDVDLVFFGELHNSPIAHWLELRILKSLSDETAGTLKLGMEQFEADNQLIIDEYFAGLISLKKFKDEVRLWSNYNTDYAPLVEYAKENSIPLFATNIPRRYANAVSHGGFEALAAFSDEARSYMAPLPIPYKVDSCVSSNSGPMAEMMTQMAKMKETKMKETKMKEMKKMSQMPPQMKEMNFDNLTKAQAMKDATMAWNIAKVFKNNDLKAEEKIKFFHINGSAHSDNFAGIINFLKIYAPELRVKVIETVYSDAEIDTDLVLPEKEKGSANYFIVLAKDMVTSY